MKNGELPKSTLVGRPKQSIVLTLEPLPYLVFGVRQRPRIPAYVLHYSSFTPSLFRSQSVLCFRQQVLIPSSPNLLWFPTAASQRAGELQSHCSLRLHIKHRHASCCERSGV